MTVLSIIGTRPQYIKIKPIFDYCKSHDIDHKIVDTRQHYSHNVSCALIEDLNLSIDYSLSFKNNNELEFISNCTKDLGNLIKQEAPSHVLVYGDTNSTFCAALAAYKLGVKIAHVEAGERCFDMSVPEEVNRVFVDGISEVNFCSSKRSLKNVERGIFCGDLEYQLLNSIDPDVSIGDFGVMTIHRSENTSKDRFDRILSFCKKVPFEIRLFAHHRTKQLLAGGVPENIRVYEACQYTEMVEQLSRCRFIITDSGSIQKTSAFFGKKALIMRSNSEWKEAERQGFAKKFSKDENKDLAWLLDAPPQRNRELYSAGLAEGSASGIILSNI